MVDEKDQLTAARLIEVIGTTPHDAASDGTIQGILGKRGLKVSKEEIQTAADELIDGGTLEVASRKGGDRRYRLGEPDAAYRHVWEE